MVRNVKEKFEKARNVKGDDNLKKTFFEEKKMQDVFIGFYLNQKKDNRNSLTNLHMYAIDHSWLLRYDTQNVFMKKRYFLKSMIYNIYVFIFSYLSCVHLLIQSSGHFHEKQIFHINYFIIFYVFILFLIFPLYTY